MRTLIALSVPALFLAACASTSGDNPSYQAELEQLREECTARGGVLQAISDTITAHPRADYACRMQDVNLARGRD